MPSLPGLAGSDQHQAVGPARRSHPDAATSDARRRSPNHPGGPAGFEAEPRTIPHASANCRVGRVALLSS